MRLTFATITSLVFLFFTVPAFSGETSDRYLRISGVYPHLATHNQPDSNESKLRQEHGEAGIGAVVPWADRLWYMTYPQHQVTGSNDKLYEVDSSMHLVIRPESVGGTHANRMIHRESNQLIIGPYFIDAERNVRACDLQQLVGRMTATMRHLHQPEKAVYFFDMEGALYEVDVRTLAVKKLFDKPFPGWHGKGAYTSQNRVVFANNGEAPPRGGKYDRLLIGDMAKTHEEAGVLAEWDGKDGFKIIERKQFTDVTGPGGIEGASDDRTPLWAMGWDRRSVILKLLDDGIWQTFRLPKGSHSFDHRHGYYTEWPRIREYMPERLMAVMHASMFEFPKTFSRKETSGIRPLATHLRYIPDFCHWRGKTVLAADEASMMKNPMCGQAQSNLWFGSREELERFGPKAGWGGVWFKDKVRAGVPSDPFLVAGYEQRILHLRREDDRAVVVSVEVDEKGNGHWKKIREIRLEDVYAYWILPESLEAEWIRLVPDSDNTVTAYFHGLTPRESDTGEQSLFRSLVDITDERPPAEILIRPAARNRSLQCILREKEGGPGFGYMEVEIDSDRPETFRFDDLKTSGITSKELNFVEQVTKIQNDHVTVLPHTILVTQRNGMKFLLPRGDAAYDRPTRDNRLRTVREVQSERWLANIHGTFYEIPRADDNTSPDFSRMKPVASHNKRIVDYCSWRGLLVLSGAVGHSGPDGHYFENGKGVGLWFGQIDDIWKLGKPVGLGSIWKNEAVKASEASLPMLMTNYDRKTVHMSHDLEHPVTFRLECDFDHSGFVKAFEYRVESGKTFSVELPQGFQSHWIRAVVDKDCRATMEIEYR